MRFGRFSERFLGNVVPSRYFRVLSSSTSTNAKEIVVGPVEPKQSKWFNSICENISKRSKRREQARQGRHFVPGNNPCN